MIKVHDKIIQTNELTFNFADRRKTKISKFDISDVLKFIASDYLCSSMIEIRYKDKMIGSFNYCPLDLKFEAYLDYNGIEDYTIKSDSYFNFLSGCQLIIDIINQMLIDEVLI